MDRKSTGKRAPRSSQPFTPELAREIRAYVKKNPDEARHVVANRFRVNPGRVTDAINEKM